MIKLWILCKLNSPAPNDCFESYLNLSLHPLPKLELPCNGNLSSDSSWTLFLQTTFPSSINYWLQARSNQQEVMVEFGNLEGGKKGEGEVFLPSSALTFVSKQWRVFLLWFLLPLNKFLPLWCPPFRQLQLNLSSRFLLMLISGWPHCPFSFHLF